MSASVPCSCKAALCAKDNWRVVQRNCNHSAFNGGHRTPSDYSEVRCLKCNGRWRTKASYVDKLRDFFA